MKFSAIFTSFFTALSLWAAPVWFTDPAEAAEKAKQENKPVFVLFTAPDWCQPCQRLERDILSQNDFASQAAESVVLLQFDVSDLKKVPENLRESYKKWMTVHKLQTVPTMRLADAEGTPVANFVFTGDMTTESLLQDINKAVAKWQSPWFQDPEAALKEAQKTEKPLFVLFTAPGWCGPCKQLEEKIFNGTNFVSEAQKEVILVELDFSDPSTLPPQYQQSYSEWSKRYSIKAYPTMLVLDSNGEVLANIPNLRSLTAETLLQQIQKATE